MEVGAIVAFTAKSLGVMDHEQPYRFADVHVGADTEWPHGQYAGPHPNPAGSEHMADWHIVLVDVDGVLYECPVHESMFEAVG